jgi:hypothetical protein
MKRVLIFVWIALITMGLFAAGQSQILARPASGGPETMAAANRLYESGQFEQAALAYQSLVDEGFADSALYYNLGNAYFKQGDVGSAILNFRRAERLAPRDPDIRANLELARSMTVDQIEKARAETFLDQLTRFTQERLTLDELALAALTLWFLFSILLISFMAARRGSNLREGLQYAAIVAGLLLALVGFSLLGRWHVEHTRPAAVVVVVEQDVTSGPGDQYVTEFTLHSGTEVNVLETRNNWTRLALPGNELEGWAPADSITTVTP